MPKNLAHYNLRIERDLLNKLGYIAASEERSINGELLAIIKRSVFNYEKENGEIPISRK